MESKKRNARQEEEVEVQSNEEVEANAAAPTVAPEPAPAEEKDESEVKDPTIEALADEVERGVHGSGRERMISLGSSYAAVQQEVNRRYRERQSK